MRKYGKFTIHKDWLDQAINNTVHTGDLQCILSNFLIVKAEMDFCTNSIEYIAFSDLFEETEEGSIAPTYKLLIESEQIDELPIALTFLGVEKL